MYNKEELISIVGGSISGTMINALVRALDILLEIGRSLGTSIRRYSSGNYC